MRIRAKEMVINFGHRDYRHVDMEATLESHVYQWEGGNNETRERLLKRHQTRA